jgi:Zn-dependent alcohol dehydrogenase
MRAAVLVELNKPLLLADIDLTELTTGQVLVKVLVSGICGSQLHDINGNKGNVKFLPHLMGHEGCGIVEGIGPGVLTVKPGDKVVMHWRPGLGIDSNFPQYILNGKKFSSGKVNTLTEQAIVSENKLTVIPSDTNPEFAALLGCSLTTALGIIENESYLRFGETVAVVGCGGVGLIVIAAARLRGAGEIYAVDNSTVKKDLSFDYGANFFHETVANLPENIDLLIDTTGNVEIISESFKKLSINGRILLVGQPAPDQSLIIPNAIKLFSGSGLLIKASQGGGSIPHEDIPRYLKLLSLGYLSIEKLITHRYKLSEVNEAFKTLKSGKSGRIMIGINK